jgi:hypothetical protein
MAELIVFKRQSVYNIKWCEVAGVAELADALDLGSSGSNPLEVQILSPAPLIKKMLSAKPEKLPCSGGSFYYERPLADQP